MCVFVVAATAATAGAEWVHSHLRVPVICANEATLTVDLPQLDLAVHARRKEQVCGVGEEANRCNALWMASPRVDKLLWQEALLWLLPKLAQSRAQVGQRACACMCMCVASERSLSLCALPPSLPELSAQ